MESVGDKEEWPLKQVNALDAWKIPLPPKGKSKGEDVKIAHLDTGYTDHYEFFGDGDVSISEGYNYEENVRSPKEPLKTIDKGHGTATGSVLISGNGPSNTNPNPDKRYVSGIAPKARLVPIRVDTDVWYVNDSNDVRGVKHAISIGAHVISMSRGGLGISSKSLKKAIIKANKQGIIVVAAAGNCVPKYLVGCKVIAPAKFNNVIGVGATTYDEKTWNKSSRGSKVNVCAPGAGVLRARTRKKNGDYQYDVKTSSGTSYATALVAGTAALWIAFNGGREELSRKLGGRPERCINSDKKSIKLPDQASQDNAPTRPARRC